MKKIFFVLFVAAGLISCSAINNADPLAPGQITSLGQQQNIVKSGVQFKTKDGETLFGNGGCMLQVGDYFYWYGEYRYSSGNAKGVSCYRSKDLVTWEWRNAIINDQWTSDEISPVFIERPKVIYNAKTGKYVLWAHREGTGWNYGMASIIVAEGDEPDGDFRFVHSFRPFDDLDDNTHDSGYTDNFGDTSRPNGYMSRDCTLFVDDDGYAYFASSYRENTWMNIYRLTDDYLYIDVSYSLKNNLLNHNQAEAPCLIKRNGIYYMVVSGTDGWNVTPTFYFWAKNLQGPWSSAVGLSDNSNNATGNGAPNSLVYSDKSQPAYVAKITATNGSGNYSFLYMGDRWGPAHGGSSTYNNEMVWAKLEFDEVDKANDPGRMYMHFSEALQPDVERGEINFPQYYYIKNERGYYLTDATDITASGQILAVKNSVTQSKQNWGHGVFTPYLSQFRIIPNADGTYQIINRYNGYVLESANNEALSYVVMNEPKEEGSKYQNWKIEKKVNDNLYSFQNVASGAYLTGHAPIAVQGQNEMSNAEKAITASWGYYVGWQSDGAWKGHDESWDKIEVIKGQRWQLIPVAPDNMSEDK